MLTFTFVGCGEGTLSSRRYRRSTECVEPFTVVVVVHCKTQLIDVLRNCDNDVTPTCLFILCYCRVYAIILGTVRHPNFRPPDVCERLPFCCCAYLKPYL